MKIPKILWLDDQFEDFYSYKAVLFRSGYLVENVKSVSETEKKLREYDYVAVIFDLKVLPGCDVKWIQFNEQERKKNPYLDSILGFELLRSLLHSPKARVKIDPPIKLDPKKVIVFSNLIYSQYFLKNIGNYFFLIRFRLSKFI